MLGLLRRLQPPVTHNDPQVSLLLEQLGARRLEPHRELRGHDFFPARAELARVPSIRAARRQRPAGRVLHLHYFTAYCDYFVAGFDPRTGWAYGYTDEPALDLQDWGCFDLNYLCGTVIACDPPVVVWRDREWRPQPARGVLEPGRLAG